MPETLKPRVIPNLPEGWRYIQCTHSCVVAVNSCLCYRITVSVFGHWYQGKFGYDKPDYTRWVYGDAQIDWRTNQAYASNISTVIKYLTEAAAIAKSLNDYFKSGSGKELT